MSAPVLPGLFDPPIAPSGSPIARHSSAMGALDAAERVGRQSLALLTLYQQQGPLTDCEAAEAMGVERSTVNARRSELIKRGLVQAVGSKKNAQTGITNTLWGRV